MNNNNNSAQYTIGLDYGTNTLRALIVRTSDGAEVGTAVYGYPHGTDGVILDSRIAELARQHPNDYLTGAAVAVPQAVADAHINDTAFSPTKIVGIGVDTTGSSPMPVDTDGNTLVDDPRFAENPDACVWLWKDHTATHEAAEITCLADAEHPEYLRKCGGAYSTEWFWSKMLHCARFAPSIAEAAAGWIEIADWIPAMLCGTPAKPVRGVCAAGHKGLYHSDWGGYPDRAFLAQLHPDLARWRDHLDSSAGVYSVDHPAGRLSEVWATKLGIPAGIPVVGGALDAHLGAIGSGIGAGTLVKIMGTSTCDIMVAPLAQNLPDVPGLCGIVPESVLPGFYGLEAGQSAVGDLFAWWVGQFDGQLTHEILSERASVLKAGESGLLALDWNNGNRTVLIDQRLTGLLIGQTLATRPEEIYRALIEATAFGARVIVERLAEYGIAVDQVVVCGGLAERSPLTMQIYADILNRPIRLSRSSQTCALGSAIAAAVVAGVYTDFGSAQAAMCGLKPTEYRPNAVAVPVYEELCGLYRHLHDAFGLSETASMSLYDVMKRLIALREQVRGVVER